MNRSVKIQGIECPIIREGDNIVDIVVDSVLYKTFLEKEERVYSTREWYLSGIDDRETYVDEDGDKFKIKHIQTYDIQDKSVIGITESVVARAAGQYITVDNIATDIEKKFGKDATICLINPIYSRNRFAMILKGIARSAKEIIIVMPDYDEVGNPRGVNPFTGVNIEEYYKELCKSENCECEIANSLIQGFQLSRPNNNTVYCGLHNYLNWQDNIHYTIDVYTRNQNNMYTLLDICSDKSPDWGVLGTNKATEERLKLFPSKAECQRVCEAVKEKIKEKTGKEVICCIYGDGAFKDPVGGIWEFADPVTMPGYTDKELIESTPSEIKLKAMIDSQEPHLYPGYEKDNKAIMDTITINHSNIIKGDSQMGTTPRLYRDLLASLMDLTSGSGDRATPVVLVQNYF